jgi:hypothetical protein
MLPPQIPAYPRSTRKRHDRPVTPEVAGSSPVAPVSPFGLQIGFSLANPVLGSFGSDHVLELWRRKSGHAEVLR